MAWDDFGMNKISQPLRDKSEQSAPGASGPVIVEYVGKATERILARIEACKGTIRREINLISAIAVELPFNALTELSRTMGIARIWEDAAVYAMLERVGSDLGSSQAHESGYTGKGVVVALLDTGVYPHPDLTTPENRILAWHDLVHNLPEPYDDNGHGTHLAGVIAGNGVSSHGRYCGMAPDARLVAVKVLNQDGVGRLSDLLAGLEWCLAHRSTLNMKVINLSLGAAPQAAYSADPLCRAVALAVQKGVTVCAPFAAVNSGNIISSPGMSPAVISVANYNGQKTFNGAEILSWEKGGSVAPVVRPDLIAPGMDVTSLSSDGDYRALSGASVATSLVSGTIALILQKWPSLQPERIKGMLRKNARDLGVGVNLQGAGLLCLDEIFNLTRKKAARSEVPHGDRAPRGSYDDLLKILLSLMGSNAATANPNQELLKNLLLSLMKGFK